MPKFSSYISGQPIKLTSLKHVIILGGGVAGLSAAHELLKRDYKVSVYEHKNIPGGKARSLPVPGSGTDGRKNLPGEHGFRFFPRFYKHLPATLQEIPTEGGKTVYDNLVDTTRILVARFDEAPILMTSRFPRSLSDLKVIFNDIFKSDYGLKPGESEFFAEKLWQLMTSCKERRLAEYEKIGWWDYIEADSKSDAYKTLLAEGLTRTLVAAQPKYASTRTGGDILLQLMFDMMSPGASTDRVLNAPTNDAWIDPWLKYLNKEYNSAFEYHLNYDLDSIKCDASAKQIESVNVRKVLRSENGTITGHGDIETITGDSYICALPVEVMAKKLNEDMLKADSTLASIKQLAPDVAWMNGMQFYLKKNIPIDHGHSIYVDTPWALTSISQIQFWNGFPIEQYGNGEVKGILSVDISDWFQNGIVEHDSKLKQAHECTREEIMQDVWAQLKKSLNVQGKVVLEDSDLVTWFIDPDIVTPDSDRPSENSNLEPLLVNKINTWHLRPEAHTRIKNLYLAADYIQTNTDLATMEGANEAARRAVNSILENDESGASYCKIWDLHEPDILGFWRWMDKKRFEKGMPWSSDTPFLRRLWLRIVYFFKNLF